MSSPTDSLQKEKKKERKQANHCMSMKSARIPSFFLTAGLFQGKREVW